LRRSRDRGNDLAAISKLMQIKDSHLEGADRRVPGGGLQELVQSNRMGE